MTGEEVTPVAAGSWLGQWMLSYTFFRISEGTIRRAEAK
jgi:hypothetical protein